MASTLAVAATPSPPSSVHTPGTPKHGFSDPWEPFSPRKSARLSSRKPSERSHRTPSPRSSAASLIRAGHHAASTKSSTVNIATPIGSPMKKRMPAMDAVRRASGILTAEATTSADALGFSPASKSQQSSKEATAISRSAGMLPTPAKTPRKQPDAKTEAASRAIARNLFASDAESMPTPKKKAKKYSGLTLDSFTAEDIELSIPIFTDSRDRIPESDYSTENPFLTTTTATVPQQEPTKRRSQRKKLSIPGEGRQTIEEAVQRDDGIVYVFRGKKIFRKFTDSNDVDSIGDAEDDGEDVDFPEDEPKRHMTRSSIKPRLLFPTGKKGKTTATDDEEAATDIEDIVLPDADHEDTYFDVLETPVKKVHKQPDTPEAPKFGPGSPPTTMRARRVSSKDQADDTPMKKAGKPRSPFDGWRRSKSRTEPQHRKRPGEPTAEDNVASKRQRA